MKRFLHYIIIFIVCFKSYSQDSSVWKSINKATDFSNQKLRNNIDLDYKLLFSLNEVSFKQALKKLEVTSNKNEGVKISIPNSNGTLEQFIVKESSNFASELQALYPEIRSYSGTGITDPNASISISVSPNGIQTMVLRSDTGSEFIESLAEDKSIYVLSTSKNKNAGISPLNCKTISTVLNKALSKKTNQLKSSNGVFKTMRLALSCTGEYAAYFGGTVAGALAGMNATMTRVNAIFNKDLALKLEIIANNNLIIYINAAKDPYSDETQGLKTISGCTGDCPGTWNKEAQNTITDVIGEGNYDIGHLFTASGGGGDAGCIGCVCSSLTNTNSTPVFSIGKGSGYTSPADSKPEGSTFDID